MAVIHDREVLADAKGATEGGFTNIEPTSLQAGSLGGKIGAIWMRGSEAVV